MFFSAMVRVRLAIRLLLVLCPFVFSESVTFDLAIVYGRLGLACVRSTVHV